MVRGREPHRLRVAVRSGAAPRGWNLSLHSALGGRRHRFRRDACHSRRGPRHQHSRADPDFRGAGRRSAALRPSQPPDRRRRRRTVEALGRAVDRRVARQGNRAARRRRARGARRARPRRCGRSPRSTNWPGLVDLSHLSHGAARFDEAELEALSARTLHRLSFAAVADRLAALGFAGPNAEALWLAVRGNLSRLDDAAIWRQVAEGEVAPIVEDADYLKLAAACAPEGAWDQSTWGAWTSRLKETHRPQGAGAVSPVAARLDRPGGRAGACRPSAADWPG